MKAKSILTGLLVFSLLLSLFVPSYSQEQKVIKLPAVQKEGGKREYDSRYGQNRIAPPSIPECCIYQTRK